MLQTLISRCFLATLFFCVPCISEPDISTENAEQVDETITVSVNPFPPFIILRDSNQTPTGFDIDLWQAIAEDLDLSYVYRPVKTLKDLFDDLVEDRSDISIGGLTITLDREQKVDFSHQYIEAGLQILVRNQINPSVFRSLGVFLKPQFLNVLGVWLMFTLVFSHLVWWAEREEDETYWANIWEWTWWLHVTIATVGYGDKVPRNSVGRLIGLVVIYTGIGFFLYCTAEFSSAITMEKLKADITEPSDLHNRRVATVRDSTSVNVLENIGANIILANRVDSACQKLINKDVDAVVYDSPNLQHYARSEGQTRVVGPIFETQHYAIALQANSPLREKINQALLKLKENGQYQKIYQKWFSQPKP